MLIGEEVSVRIGVAEKRMSPLGSAVILKSHLSQFIYCSTGNSILLNAAQ